MTSNTFIYFIISCAALHIPVSSSSELGGKIIGGAVPGDQGKRFMISLQVDEKHLCCGFLASWRIGISTAFCVIYIRKEAGEPLTNATIYYGSIHLDVRSGRHREKIDHLDSHPQYGLQNPERYQSFDIGYVLFGNELCMDHFYLTTLDLASDAPSVHSRIYTYGWGSEQFQDPQTELSRVHMAVSLKEMEVVLADPMLCSVALGRCIKHDEMCVKGVVQNESSGMGDAGSPMVKAINVAHGIASVVNIISNYHPIVFIRLEYYTTYIEDLKKKYICEQPERVLQSERRKRMKKIGRRRAENECGSRLRASDEKVESLPDLNENVDSEGEEESTLH